MLKILRMAPYYRPERVSSSHLTDDKEKAYINAGFNMKVICPSPTRGVTEEEKQKYKKRKYESLYDGKLQIERFSMLDEKRNPVSRAIRYILCNVIQYRKGILEKDVDIVIGASTPPTQGILCGLVAKRLSKSRKKKVPFVYNLQDIFPDSLITTGLAKKDGIIWKIGRIIEKRTYSYADKIIVISEDMKKNLIRKGVPENKIAVIRNWIDTDKVSPVEIEDNKLTKELKINTDRFRVVYAGNLGLAQGVDTLLHAAKLLEKNSKIEFLIFGSGAAEETLKKQAENMSNVKFYPMQPIERVSEVYSIGDCCVVLCKRGTGGIGVPSKTWSIMACGRPLLVSFDEGELKDTIYSAKAGLCSDAENAKQLADHIIKLANDSTLCDVYSKNAREYAVRNVGRDNAVEKYVKLLFDMI